jgi:hypothetical protein
MATPALVAAIICCCACAAAAGRADRLRPRLKLVEPQPVPGAVMVAIGLHTFPESPSRP